MIQLNGLESIVVKFSKGHYSNITLNKLLAIYTDMNEEDYDDHLLYDTVARVAAKVLNPDEWLDVLIRIQAVAYNPTNKDPDFFKLNSLRVILLSTLSLVSMDRIRFTTTLKEI